MLSLYTLESASNAYNYYQKGDYYTQGGVEEYSQWLGKGSELLNLEGSVDFKIFKDLLEGRLPNGTLMSQTEKGLYHRPGYDLTFSPPKSVSILALVAGNQDVLAAHREAVQSTLAYLEEKYAGCRNNNKGIVNIERTGNFTVATFEHGDSRAGDPALHTHTVLMNVTQKANGDWRTVYADEIYTHVLLNGKVYDSYLVQGLMKRGYELEFGEKGKFEIKDVSKELIDFYSKRRLAIKSWLENHELSGSKAAELANFLTREAKVSVSPEERQKRWLQELNMLGSSVEILQKVQAIAKEKGPILPPDPRTIALHAIDSAMHHLSERQSTFSFQELIQSAKRLSLLLTNEGDLLNVVEQKIADKSLIYLENKLLTTPEAGNLEQKNIAILQGSKQSVEKIMPQWIAEIAIHFKTVDKKEGDALASLLSCSDRQALISSNSKNKLDRTLKNFIALSSAQKFYPRVLVQNRTAIEPLETKLHTERVHTIEGFLLACEERAANRNEPPNLLEKWERRFKGKEARDIWIVYHDISARQLNRLGHWAEELGARIVFAQLKEKIAALEPLKDKGLHEIKLHASQKNIAELKTQEGLLRHLQRLERHQNLHEIYDSEKRLQQAVDGYLSVSNKTPLLLTLNHSGRRTLNLRIHQALKQNGILKNESHPVESLAVLNMSLEEKSQAHFYQPGDIIRFNRDLPETLIKKDSYLEVYQVNLESGLVEFRQKDLQIFWAPAQDRAFLKQVEVYKKESKELQEGDVICWSRTLKNKEAKELDRIKGERAIVTAIHKNTAALQLQNGQQVILKAEDITQQHWDYGYAAHLKNVNASSIKEAIIVLQHQHLNPKSTESLSVFLSNAKALKIKTQMICNDIQGLKQGVEKSALNSLSLDNVAETPYKREEALEDYQHLATQPLFNRLQSEFLKANQLNPEFLAENLKEAVETTHASLELRAAAEIVDKVCVYHSERDAVLNLEQLKKDAVKLGALSASVEDIEKAFELALEKGWLISLGKNEQAESLVTTRHGLLLEELCIQKIKNGQHQLKPILSENSAEMQTISHHKRLTSGQKEAIRLILTTSDRVVAVQGIAGAGKTTALKEINRLCVANNHALVLANTASAKNQAKTASGLAAQTSAQFLTRMETELAKDIEKARQEFGGNRLFILDESSLASSKDFFRLASVVEKLEARLALIGDFKQLGSIGAGLFFHDALAYGIQKAVMKENVRLNEITAFSAMQKAYQGDMSGALQILKDSIEEIPDKAEALNRIASVYIALSKIEKEPPLIITPLNEDRHYVNNLIREKLKEKKQLEGEGLRVDIFVPTNKREIDKSDIFSYKSQDVIRFNTSSPRLNIKAGDYADILQIDLKHQRLTLRIDNKKEFYWSPKDLNKPSSIEIYKREYREFSANELIVFKRNQEAQGIFNGDKATIVKVEGGKADVLLANGNLLSIDLTQKQNQHLDYGYALTTYAAQGRDVKFVIAYGEGPKTYERKTSALKIDDIIILPKKTELGSSVREHSKVVKITAMNKTELTLEDRDGHVYKVKSNQNQRWSYFPPIEQRKAEDFPLSTSQESFIIQITRGDGLLLIVPNIDDFQNTLEKHQQLKKSALSYHDPKWQSLNAGVKRLVENIKGKAEAKIIGQESTLSNQISKHSTSFKKTDAFTKSFSHRSNVQFVDSDELNHRLERDALSYASQWRGSSPSSVTGHEARWGKKGSFSLVLQGSKKGCWHNFETNQKGKGLISLYMHCYGVKFKEAVQELAKNVGLDPEQKNASIKSATKKLEEPSIRLEKQESLEKEIQTRINEALQKYDRAVPIQGTLAEKYLRDYRKIAGELPKDFRFLKSDFHLHTKKYIPALVAPYRDKDHKMVGIVRIYLNKDGSQYKATYIDAKGDTVKAASKANKGISSHGLVIVQEGILERTLWIAEGVETALSIAQVVPHQTVMATLASGQLPNIPIGPETQKVIICADNDPASSNTKQNVVKAVETFLSKGVRVFIALPPGIPEGMKKYDFNDLLKDGGIAAVEKTLHEMIEIKDVSLLKTNEPRLEPELNNLRAKIINQNRVHSIEGISKEMER